MLFISNNLSFRNTAYFDAGLYKFEPPIYHYKHLKIRTIACSLEGFVKKGHIFEHRTLFRASSMPSKFSLSACICILFLIVSSIVSAPVWAQGSETSSDNPSSSASPTPYTPPTLLKATQALTKEEYDRVITATQKALKKIDERYYDQAYTLLGKAQYHKHSYDDAYRSLNTSLHYRARNSDVLHYLGLIYKERKEYEQAILTFKEAIWFNDFTSISPGASYAQLSSIYLAKGEPEKAKEYLQIAQKTSPADTSSAMSLARYYVSDGMHLEATQLLVPLMKSKDVDAQEKVEITLLHARYVLTAPHGTFDKTVIRGVQKELLALTTSPAKITEEAENNEDESEEDEQQETEVNIDEYDREKLLALSYVQLAEYSAAQKSLNRARELRSNAQDDDELLLIERQLKVAEEADPDYSSEEDSDG